MACYIPRWYTRPKTVTHPGTNRARRALTSFMRRTPLTTTPRRQPTLLSTARVSALLHHARSMRQASRHGRVSVRLSVCLSRRSTAAATCGRFAAERGRGQQMSIDACRRPTASTAAARLAGRVNCGPNVRRSNVYLFVIRFVCCRKHNATKFKRRYNRS